MTRPDHSLPEWNALASAWRARPLPVAPDPAALRAHIAVETRRMRWMVIGELGLTLVVLVLAGWALAFHRTPFTTVLALDSLGMLLLAWSFALWSRRRLWRPLTETTDAFRVLIRRRARMRLASAYFILAALGVQLLVVVLVASPTAGGGGTETHVLPAVVTLAFLAWAAWLERTARRQLRALSHADGDDGDDVPAPLP